MKDNVWCLKKNSWIHINVCLSAQSNPRAHCPKRCEQRNLSDDRSDEEQFYPKKKEV